MARKVRKQKKAKRGLFSGLFGKKDPKKPARPHRRHEQPRHPVQMHKPKKKKPLFSFGKKKPQMQKLKAEPKAAKPEQQKPTQKPAQKGVKDVLHSLWFSKKEEGYVEKNRASTESFGDVYKELDLYERNVEKKIQILEREIESRMTGIDQSMSTVKQIIDDLRKENQELRSDRQFFLEKLKSLMMEGRESEVESVEQAQVETVEEEKKGTEQRGGRIETSLDNLLDLVLKKGSVKIPEAAKQLHVKNGQIEEWAGILEEHGLIEIHYPTVGTPVLKKK